MKLSKTITKILNNEIVLYFVLFLAVINVLGYLLHGKINAVIFFTLVSYLTFHFSKNLVVVFAIAIVVTNLLMVGNKVREGLENATKDEDDKKEKKAPAKKSTMTQDTKEPVKDKPKSKPKTSTLDTVVTPLEPTKEGEGMNVMSNKKRNRIDYASTVEDAYEDLDRILGGEGIKQLTDDTQKLMGQQMQLVDAMKQMTPLLDNAKSMLKGFDMDSLNSIAGFAKNFGPGDSGP